MLERYRSGHNEPDSKSGRQLLPRGFESHSLRQSRMYIRDLFLPLKPLLPKGVKHSPLKALRGLGRPPVKAQGEHMPPVCIPCVIAHITGGGEKPLLI